MFKDFYLKEEDRRLSILNEVLSSLNEESEDDESDDSSDKIVSLSSKGLDQLFKKNFDDSLENLGIDKNDPFLVFDTSTDEGKDHLRKLLKKTRSDKRMEILLLKPMQSGTNKGYSRLIKPNAESQIYEISKEILGNFNDLDSTWKTIPADEKKFIQNIYDRNARLKKDGEKSSSDSYLKISDTEAKDIINLLSKYYPKKYVKGVYYFQNKRTGVIYTVIYNKLDPAFKKDDMFEKYREYSPNIDYDKDGVKITSLKLDARSQEQETIQVLGFYYDAEESLKRLNSYFDRLDFPGDEAEGAILKHDSALKDIIEPFLNSLEHIESKSFVNIIKRINKNFCYLDWKLMFTLGIGATRFAKDVLKTSNSDMVFKNINEFKKAEADKMGSKESEDYGKISTVDVVVSTDLTSKQMMEYIRDPEIKLSAKDRKIVMIRGNKELGSYYQISLKLGETTARVGRAQRLFGKMVDMVVKTKDVYESYPSYGELLSESLLDKLTDSAKSGVNFLKKLGEGLYEKIRKLVTFLGKWAMTTFKKMKDSYRKDFIANTKELFGAALTESEETYNIKIFAKEMALKCMQEPEKFYDIANKKINAEIAKISASRYSDYYKTIFSDANFSSVSKKHMESCFYKQMFNYSFLKAFDHILLKSENPIEEYVDDILGLYIEAVHGSSTFPLWIIYGDEGKYVYVGSKQENKDNRKTNILTGLSKSGFHVVVLDGRTVTNGAHSFRLYTLCDLINVEGKGEFAPKYTNFKIGYDRNNLAPTFDAESVVALADLKFVD